MRGAADDPLLCSVGGWQAPEPSIHLLMGDHLLTKFVGGLLLSRLRWGTAECRRLEDLALACLVWIVPIGPTLCRSLHAHV